MYISRLKRKTSQQIHYFLNIFQASTLLPCAKKGSSLSQAARGHDGKLWFILQVYLLLSSLRIHTNFWSRKKILYALEKYLILPLKGNAAKFPLALHVQLSGTILESYVNQMASKCIISFLKLKTKKVVTNIEGIWVNSLTKRKTHSHWSCVYPRLKNRFKGLTLSCKASHYYKASHIA